MAKVLIGVAGALVLIAAAIWRVFVATDLGDLLRFVTLAFLILTGLGIIVGTMRDVGWLPKSNLDDFISEDERRLKDSAGARNLDADEVDADE